MGWRGRGRKIPPGQVKKCGWDAPECSSPARRIQFLAFIEGALVGGIGDGKCESLDDAPVSQDASVVWQRQSVRVRRVVFDEPEQATVCGEAAVLDAGEAHFSWQVGLEGLCVSCSLSLTFF